MAAATAKGPRSKSSKSRTGSWRSAGSIKRPFRPAGQVLDDDCPAEVEGPPPKVKRTQSAMTTQDTALRFEIPAHVKKLSDWNMEFTFTIYQIVGRYTNGNMAVSPINVAAALNMLSNGSRGKTAEILKDALQLAAVGSDEDINSAFAYMFDSMRHSKAAQENKGAFTITNEMYIQNSYKMLPQFVNCTKRYKWAISKVNFAVDARPLNEKFKQWLGDGVNGNSSTDCGLQDIVDNQSHLVLFNAVYFNVPWSVRFDKNKSTRALFHKTPSEKGVIRYMNLRTTLNFSEKNRPECKMIQLNYCSSGYEMYVILPKEIVGLPDLERSLTLKLFRSLRASLSPTKVEVTLPKFKIDTGLSVHEVAEKLGIAQLFNNDEVNLRGISSKEGLHSLAIIHKTHIEVDETGCVDAGQSAAPGRRHKKNMAIFNADHPFMFVIYDNRRDIILFIGRVTEPTP